MKTNISKITALSAFGVAFVLRLVAALFTVDAGTGMIKQGLKPLSIILSGASLALVAVILVFMKKTVKIKPTAVSPDWIIVIISLAVGVISVIDCLWLSPAATTPEWQIFFAKTVGMVNGIFFFIYALSALIKVDIPKWLFAVPLVCFIVKLIRFFAETTSITIITDNVFSLMFYCSVVIFTLELANVANAIGGKKSVNGLFIFGYLTAALSALAAVPRLLCFWLINGAVAHENISSTLMTLFMGIFAFSLTFNVFNKKKESAKNNK